MVKNEQALIKPEQSNTTMFKTELDQSSQVKGRSRTAKGVDPFTMELRTTRKRACSNLSAEDKERYDKPERSSGFDDVVPLHNMDELDMFMYKLDHEEDTLSDQLSNISVHDNIDNN